jgi:hypothetical protein
MAAVSNISIAVNIDTTAKTFTALAMGETSGPQNSLSAALEALDERLVHVHDELQDVIDADLTEAGQQVRDTPFVFTP